MTRSHEPFRGNENSEDHGSRGDGDENCGVCGGHDRRGVSARSASSISLQARGLNLSDETFSGVLSYYAVLQAASAKSNVPAGGSTISASVETMSAAQIT